MTTYQPNIEPAYIIKILGLFFVYFVAGKIGLGIHAFHSFAAVIWPATGIAMAALLLYGKNLWPAILLGAFCINLSAGAPIITAFLISIGNTLEAVLGVYFIKRYANLDGAFEKFEKLHNTINFIILTGLFATLISPTMGILSLRATGIISAGEFGSAWFVWWIGDVLGALIFVPFFIAWLLPRAEKLSLGKILEVLIFIFVVVVTSIVIFWNPFMSPLNIPLLYISSFPLIWGAVRLGSRGATLGILTLSVTATLSTILSRGPFVGTSISESLLYLQIFIGTISITFLIFATIVKERRHAIRDLKEHINKLQQAVEKISSADQAKNDFLAILAHELRNPLAPVLSSIELIRLHPEGLDLVELGASMDIHVHKMARLLDDLLDISKISKNKFKLQEEVFDIRSAVSQSVDTTFHSMQNYMHTLKVEVPDHPIKVLGDPLRIEQMIVNLLNNSAKYTNSGGKINLSVKNDLKGIYISIKDNGVGINPKMHSQIFEPFLQTHMHGDKKKQRDGLGIGLSLTKRLVELHGGTISVRSKGIGYGSEFTIMLPVPKVTDELYSSSTPTTLYTKTISSIKNEKKYKILVVDDNISAASGLGKLLEHSGNTVEIAEDGSSALNMVDTFKPDVVILDIGLPDMDGYEVARQIRANKKGRTTKITLIALTGYGQEEDKRKSQVAGFDHHLVKPISVKEVEKILSTL